MGLFYLLNFQIYEGRINGIRENTSRLDHQETPPQVNNEFQRNNFHNYGYKFKHDRYSYYDFDIGR